MQQFLIAAGKHSELLQRGVLFKIVRLSAGSKTTDLIMDIPTHRSKSSLLIGV